MQIKRLACVLFAVAVMAGPGSAHAALRVGAARVDQTGAFGASQSGQYDHERVYARAIVLDNGTARAAIISYEGYGDFDTAATLKAVAELLNCPVPNILITHTHTHSPGATRLETGGRQTTYTNPSKHIVEAVTQAKAKLQTARMSYGTGASYLGVNRDAIDPASRKWVQGSNLDAPVDRTVSVLSFLKPSGEPIAAYVSFGMHPINGFVMGIVSADYPGAMSRYVEKAFGDNAVVAFTQGASGDVNPLHLRPSNNAMADRTGHKITGFVLDRETSEGPLRVADMKLGTNTDISKVKAAADPKAIDQLFRFIESQGQVLGEEVIRVMTFAPKPSDEVRISGMQKVVTCPGRQRTNGDALDPGSREGQAATYKDAEPVNINVGMLGLGTVALTSVNGEIYTAIGLRMRNEAPMKNTMLVTPANIRMRGYIPDDASYGHQTFQVLNNFLQPGCAETGIVNAVVELQTQYLNGR